MSVSRFIAEHVPALRQRTAKKLIRAMAWLVAGFALTVGTTLIATTHTSARVPTLRESFHLAPPHVWGAVYVLLSAGIVVALAVRGLKAGTPLLLTSLVTFLWALATGPSLVAAVSSLVASTPVPDPPGSPTAMWFGLTLAGLIALIGLGVDDE